MGELFQIIKARRSIRSFIPDYNVSSKDLYGIINCARWAPSARNLQPLEYVIVRDKKSRDLLAEYSRQPQPSQVSVCIVVIGDETRAGWAGKTSSHDTSTEWKGKNRFLFLDCGASIENLLIAATSIGIDSLWISSFDDEKVKKMLNLPGRFHPLAIICVGKRLNEPKIPPKRKKNDIIHHEIWKPKKTDESYVGYSKKINK